jgi:hypothetical protein
VKEKEAKEDINNLNAKKRLLKQKDDIQNESPLTQ